MRDLDLVRHHWPVEVRGALEALFAIDAALGDVVRTTTEPALGAIRLAWWRERLEALDAGEVPAEPRLQDAAAHLLSAGISGRDLAALESGWSRLFEPFPWSLAVAEALVFRGRHLFSLAGRLLGEDRELLCQAGGLWALADAARHCSDRASRDFLIGQARIVVGGLAGAKFARAERPIGVLAALAARDAIRGAALEPEAVPGRAAAILKHRMTGRLPSGN